MGRKASGPRLARIAGRRKWYIRDTINGESKVFSTGTEDKAEADRLLADYAATKDLPERPTVGQLIDYYMKARTHLPTHGGMAYFAKRPKAEWGNLYPDQITDRLVAEYIERHGDRTMTRRELEMVSTAISRKLPMPSRKPPRERYLTREEAKRLYDAAQSIHLKLFILIGLETGQRAGAILDLTWDRVDLDRGVLDFRNPEKGETKKRRGVCRVGQTVVAALQDAKQFARTDHVIEYRGKRLSRRIWNGFKKCAERAGVPWAHPHTLKHTRISWMAEAGFTVDQIADYTDTTRDTVWRVYRKVNPDYQQDVLDVMGEFLGNPVTRTYNGKGKQRTGRKGKSGTR